MLLYINIKSSRLLCLGWPKRRRGLVDLMIVLYSVSFTPRPRACLSESIAAYSARLMRCTIVTRTWQSRWRTSVPGFFFSWSNVRTQVLGVLLLSEALNDMLLHFRTQRVGDEVIWDELRRTAGEWTWLLCFVLC